MWEMLRCRRVQGMRFLRQVSIDAFVVDFYAPAVKLAIEIDGPVHDTEERKKRDAWRQSQIERHGITFLRFSDVRARTENVIVAAEIGRKVTELLANKNVRVA